MKTGVSIQASQSVSQISLNMRNISSHIQCLLFSLTLDQLFWKLRKLVTLQKMRSINRRTGNKYYFKNQKYKVNKKPPDQWKNHLIFGKLYSGTFLLVTQMYSAHSVLSRMTFDDY